jgi:uncharacterized protein YdhG (YjbR/CyaY superfamily)
LPKTKFADIDEYIAGYPGDVRKILQKPRRSIREAAPDAEASLSYQIPTFKLDGRLVCFALFKNHISFFPTLSPFKKFEKELLPYVGKRTKGTVQFPLDRLIPFNLVKRIVKFGAKENRKERPRRKNHDLDKPNETNRQHILV